MRNLPKRPFGTVVTKRNVGFAVHEFGRVAPGEISRTGSIRPLTLRHYEAVIHSQLHSFDHKISIFPHCHCRPVKDEGTYCFSKSLSIVSYQQSPRLHFFFPLTILKLYRSYEKNDSILRSN